MLGQVRLNGAAQEQKAQERPQRRDDDLAVRATDTLDLANNETVKIPRSKLAQLGVTYPDGKPLPNDDLPASLLLPMGRTGPAFLAYANFAAYTEWNNSLIYSTTAAYLAARIAGAAPMRQPAAPHGPWQRLDLRAACAGAALCAWPRP